MQLVALYRYIEELVPQKVYGFCASILFLLITTGAFLAFISASILPADARRHDLEDYEIWKIFSGSFLHDQHPSHSGETDLLENQTWRLIFAIPFLLYIA